MAAGGMMPPIFLYYVIPTDIATKNHSLLFFSTRAVKKVYVAYTSGEHCQYIYYRQPNVFRGRRGIRLR
jgi:hypothetical protein